MNTEDTLIISCPTILTFDEAAPRAEAVVVGGGVIRAVGTLEEARAFAPVGREIRLEEGALLPGFIDSHSHLSLYAQCRSQFYCDTAYGTVAKLTEAFRAYADARPGEAWLLGYCYDDTGMGEPRHLTRHDLDAVCADRPVFVSHITSHMGYGNTEALRRLGITADLRVEGGSIALGEDGRPEGLLRENAYFEAFRKIPACPPESLPGAIERAVADYNRAGFTAFQDGGIGLGPGAHAILRAYNDLARQGRLNARGYLHFMPPLMDELLETGVWNLPVSDHLYYGGVKSFADGSIQSLTAVLGAPYACRPGFCGDEVASPRSIADLIGRYHRLGVPVAFHANGDAAIEYVTRGFEEALAACPRKVPGHMIIHTQMASDDQLARLHACGVTPPFFVRHVNVWGERHVNIFLGEERAARLDPCGSCVRLGIPFALHVDSPVQPVDAIRSIHTAVNRTTSAGRVLGPDQRVSTLHALRAYTADAARCAALQGRIGRIAPGLFADFVQLSADPLATPPEALEKLSVLRTICGGRVVYEA